MGRNNVASVTVFHGKLLPATITVAIFTKTYQDAFYKLVAWSYQRNCVSIISPIPTRGNGLVPFEKFQSDRVLHLPVKNSNDAPSIWPTHICTWAIHVSHTRRPLSQKIACEMHSSPFGSIHWPFKMTDFGVSTSSLWKWEAKIVPKSTNGVSKLGLYTACGESKLLVPCGLIFYQISDFEEGLEPELLSSTICL